jgi:uncharacterized protein with HEPN domain
MQPEAKKYLHDIKLAADAIAQFTSDKTFSDYVGDLMLRSAVERQFEIIGEALSKVSQLDVGVAARISEHRRIIAFRNLLIHAYADVDDRLVWDVIATKLPGLRAELSALLNE